MSQPYFTIAPIGTDVEFFDTCGTKYHAKVVAVKDGVSYGAVFGYAHLFPLTPLTPEQMDAARNQPDPSPTSSAVKTSGHQEPRP